uniref:Glycerol kinase n=1 Tax=Meloidogyne hapla TaxID=6305 RepID=A0A1I8BG38_MELHA
MFATTRRNAILAFDVGTTNLKVCTFTGDDCTLMNSQTEELSLITSKDDQLVEIEPNLLLEQIFGMIQSSLAEAEKMNLTIVSIGLSCHRNSFVTLNRKTLEPCHRIITWKDKRAQQFCDEWNNSYKRKLLNLLGLIASTFTGSERFKAARMFNLLDVMVAPRFSVILQKDQKMQELLSTNNLILTTLDCWILQKLTNNSDLFTTEPSSVSSTGLFDPFTSNWGDQILQLIGFPISSILLPSISKTSLLSLKTDINLFGREIQISSCLGDAQSATFGSGCIIKGDVNLSLGTGALLDFVTGDEVHASMCGGVYPLIGWKLDEQSTTYLLESKFNNLISSLKWANLINLIPSLSSTDLNKQCEELFDGDEHLDENGDDITCFIPYGSKNIDCSSLIGIRSTTNQKHITRSIIKSILFGIYQIWNCLLSQLSIEDIKLIKRIRCCGGISLNNFICQQISTLINLPLERVSEPQFCSAKGVALLAGLGNGFWTLDQIKKFIIVERCFEPNKQQRISLLVQYNYWLDTQKRCLY